MVFLFNIYHKLVIFFVILTGLGYLDCSIFLNILSRSTNINMMLDDIVYAFIGILGTFPLINDYTRLLYAGRLFLASFFIVLLLTIIFAIIFMWCSDVIAFPSVAESLSILYGGDKARWWGEQFHQLDPNLLNVSSKVYWKGGHTYLFPTNWFLDEATIINYILYIPEFVFLFCLFCLFFHGLFATTLRDVELDEYPILVNLYIVIISGVFFSVAILFYEINYMLFEYFQADSTFLKGDGRFWSENFEVYKIITFGTTYADLLWNANKATCRLSGVMAASQLQPLVAVDFFVKSTGVLCIIQGVCNPLIIYIKCGLAILACLMLLVIGCSSFFNNHRLNNYEFAFIFSLVVYTSWILLATVSWLILYLTLELQALCLLILIAWEKNSILALNTSLKYGVVNIVASAFFLFGIIHVILLQGDHIISYTLITLNLHLTRTNTDTFLDFLFNAAGWDVFSTNNDANLVAEHVPNILQAAASLQRELNKEILDQLVWGLEYPVLCRTDLVSRMTVDGKVDYEAAAAINAKIISDCFPQSLSLLEPKHVSHYLNMQLATLYSSTILNFNQTFTGNVDNLSLCQAIGLYQNICEEAISRYHYNPTINNPWICLVNETMLNTSELGSCEKNWAEFFKLSQYRKIMFLSSDLVYTQIYTIALSFILIGLLIKLGAAPLAFWLAEVYAGMSVPVLILFATVPKLTYIFILFNSILAQFYSFALYSPWYADNILPLLQNLFLLLALISAGMGAKGILDERKNLFEFLAWSSVINLGFLFLICSFSLIPSYVVSVGIAAEIMTENFVGQALQNGLILSLVFFFYYFIQILFVLGVFNFCFFFQPQRSLYFLSDLLVFSRHSSTKFLLFVLCLSFLSLFGLPPLAGFWGKFFILLKLFQSYNVTFLGMCVMFVILVLNIIGGFGYIKIVYILIAEQREESDTLTLAAVKEHKIIFCGYFLLFCLWQYFSFVYFQMNCDFFSFFDFSNLGEFQTTAHLVSLLSLLS